MRLKQTADITQGTAVDAAGANPIPSSNLQAHLFDDGALAVINRIKVAIQNLTVEDIHNTNQLVSGLYYWNTSYGHYNSIDTELLKTWKYTNRGARGIGYRIPTTAIDSNQYNLIATTTNWLTGNKDAVDHKLGNSRTGVQGVFQVAIQNQADGFFVAIPLNHISAFFRQRMWALRNSGTVNIDIKLESAIQAIVCRELNNLDGFPAGYTFAGAGATAGVSV